MLIHCFQIPSVEVVSHDVDVSKESVSGPECRGIDPRPGHNIFFENGSQTALFLLVAHGYGVIITTESLVSG